jgi:hypothetical protein
LGFSSENNKRIQSCGILCRDKHLGADDASDVLVEELRKELRGVHGIGMVKTEKEKTSSPLSKPVDSSCKVTEQESAFPLQPDLIPWPQFMPRPASIRQESIETSRHG